MRRVSVIAGMLAAGTPAGCGDNDPDRPPRALLFTRTIGYRHADAIDASTAVLPDALAAVGLGAEVTEDPAVFTPDGLASYRCVVFLYTSGNDLLDATGKAALEAFVRGGGGWVGVHSAADTEYAWPFYQSLVVEPFLSHPVIQPATVVVEAASHPALAAVPAGAWTATDEWYNFPANPRDVPGVTVLATLDEASYTGGTMGADHPIIWAHEDLGGRALYSAPGHVAERWSDPVYRAHVVDAIAWACSRP